MHRRIREVRYERLAAESGDTHAIGQLFEVDSYNERGDLIAKTEWSKDGHAETKRYEYSPDGRHRSMLEYDDRGNLENKTLFTYDNFGRRVETAMLDIHGNVVMHTTYRYDSEGRKEEEVLYVGGISWRNRFHYNDRGLVAETLSYAGASSFKVDTSQDVWVVSGAWSAGDLMSKVVDEYDETGRLVATLRWDGSGTMIGREVYRYGGGEQQMTEIFSYGPDGAVVARRGHRYEEYDYEGNWVTVVTLAAPDEHSAYRREHVTHRLITYY
jgi:antitoxin component YwqK of YwqJK toxin-antitoxin module